MNTTDLKAYAPKARRDFIAAVTKQAQKYGVTESIIHPVEINGDVCVVNGKPFPAIMAPRIKRLAECVERLGFNQTMEQVAYSWFNRLIAIRYMELHDYLGHGRRVLSHPEHPTGFQILEECTDLSYGNDGDTGQLPHLTHEKVVELKLDGTKDEELYRELLLAQCHALHTAMPFLFEPVDDETELLLPENLTKTDSLIHDLITDIAESDWDNIEVIGWLYQFYISEKKDQVIGKVVKSEDIPAATQLFTPNWIVKYMVQNSLGAQWLATYPESPLKAEMEYYIEPAEQTDEVNAQLKEITPDELNPEELTLIDPASGSGHILVEAYDLFKAIYLERGYRQRDIAQLILEKNLFGLDIDQRAAQMTGFALMMKGREDDRRLFERGVKLNVLEVQDSKNIDLERNWQALEIDDENTCALLQYIWQKFEQGKVFGSLIEINNEYETLLRVLLDQLMELATNGGFLQQPAAQAIKTIVRQAWILSQRYSVVIANPPYLVSNNFNKDLKSGLKKFGYKITRSDLYVIFIERLLKLATTNGDISMITMQSWMFTDSYDELRLKLLNANSFKSLVHLGSGAFESIGGEIVSTVMFNLHKFKVDNYISSFIRLADSRRGEKRDEFFNTTRLYYLDQDLMTSVSSSPIVFWKGDYLSKLYLEHSRIGDSGYFREGIHTGDNVKYVRSWWEINFDKFSLSCESIDDIDLQDVKWLPYNKGGGCVRWYGNYEFVLAFDATTREEMDTLKSHVRPSQKLYFKEGATWSDIGTKGFGVKYYPKGFLFDQKGPACVSGSLFELVSVLNSTSFTHIAETLMPTVTYRCGTVSGIPKPKTVDLKLVFELTQEAIGIAKEDDHEQELSWDFQSFYLKNGGVLSKSLQDFLTRASERLMRLKEIEEVNNSIWSKEYKIASDLSLEGNLETIDLNSNQAFRYQNLFRKGSSVDQVREVYICDIISELVSYSVGLMMGRYSLDEPGLIYANSGNEGFDASRYTKFPADDDGIIPLTDKEWFADDAANRLVEFISVAWDAEQIEENLNFLAANLSPKKGEDSRDTIRRYLCDKFYKDHMQTYKKRPIYWLFSSGKTKAFQCLVYLHRYNESTLARMRTEYVIPLTAKLSSHIDKLENDKGASGSAAEIKKLEKEIKSLHKQQTELTEFDEKLKHYADMRIPLDLDDGVKANYGKFGDLLAEVKSIHGKKPE